MVTRTDRPDGTDGTDGSDANRDSTDSRGRSDRAQLLLVGGVVIALVVLSTAVLLNGQEFRENVGGENAIRKADSAAEAAGAIERDAATMRWEVGPDTELGKHPAPNETWYRSNLTAYSDHYANASVETDGAYANVTYNDTASLDGELLVNATDGPFTSPDTTASGNWTVANNTTAVTGFVVEVNATATGGVVPPSSTSLVVNVTNATTGANWNVTVASIGGSPTPLRLRVNGSSCLAGPPLTTNATIRLTEGSVSRPTGGVTSDCRSFRFAPNVDPPYNVSFERRPGDDWVRGNYTVAVENTTGDNVPAVRSFNPPPASPYNRSVVVSPVVDLTYESARLSYRTRMRIDADEGVEP